MEEVIKGFIVGSLIIGIAIFFTVFIAYGIYLFLEDMDFSTKIIKAILIGTLILEFVGGVVIGGYLALCR